MSDRRPPDDGAPDARRRDDPMPPGLISDIHTAGVNAGLAAEPMRALLIGRLDVLATIETKPTPTAQLRHDLITLRAEMDAEGRRPLLASWLRAAADLRASRADAAQFTAWAALAETPWRSGPPADVDVARADTAAREAYGGSLGGRGPRSDAPDVFDHMPRAADDVGASGPGERAPPDGGPTASMPTTAQVARAIARRDELQRSGAPAPVVQALTDRIVELKRARMHPRHPQAGLVLLDRWVLLDKAGRGGFAEVWKAHDAQTGDTVAVKLLHSQFDDSAERRDRFFRGARQMAELPHPHVVRVIAARCVDRGFHFFVMEWLDGGDLKAAVLEGRLNPAQGLAAVRQVAWALAAAHAKGLVHRDVKPANILLTAQGRAKLTDFDLVRVGDSTGGTRTGGLGTVVYAAPEVMLAANDAQPTADVYSLGMTAMFVLRGEALGFKAVRRPAEVLAGLTADRAVRAVVARAIAEEPAARYQTLGAFIEALDRATTGGGPADAAPMGAEVDLDDAPVPIVADPATVDAAPMVEPAPSSVEQAPSSVEQARSSVKPAQPSAKPAQPSVKPARPAAEPAPSSVERAQPSAKPARPAVEPAPSSVERAQPSAKAARPAVEPAPSSVERAQPSAKPTRPAVEPAPSSVERAQPSAKPARPAVEPAPSSVERAQPSAKPERPAVEPALSSVEPAPSSVEPAPWPAEPASSSVEPAPPSAESAPQTAVAPASAPASSTPREPRLSPSTTGPGTPGRALLLLLTMTGLALLVAWATGACDGPEPLAQPAEKVALSAPTPQDADTGDHASAAMDADTTAVDRGGSGSDAPSPPAPEKTDTVSDGSYVTCQRTPRPATAEVMAEATDYRPAMMRIPVDPSATFTIGSPKDEAGRYGDEPQRSVRLTRAFWMAETEVTQGQFEAVMGKNPSYFTGADGDADRPVESVNWYTAVAYCNELSTKEGLVAAYTFDDKTVTRVEGANGYRLPTEAEWEFAARAGTSTATYAGPIEMVGSNTAPVLDDIAWYSGNNRAGETHPVKCKIPNAWGLYDMLGNVREWCEDWYDVYPEPVDGVALVDPAGPFTGANRVVRGGSYWYFARRVRSAYRNGWLPGFPESDRGFRVVRAPRAP